MCAFFKNMHTRGRYIISLVGILMIAKSMTVSAATALAPTESEAADSVYLPDVEVSVSRMGQRGTQQTMQVSVIDNRLIQENKIITPKDVSNIAPNIYMPDYGSAMTSSIYIRGLGSRINEPVMGMVVDGVPLTDKNMYDHTMQDIKRIELLRGPQGSMYGRNSPGGVMEIRSILPLDLTTRTGRGLVSYGTANSVEAQGSYYEPTAISGQQSVFGWGIAARYRRTDGFYKNTYTGEAVDKGQQAGGRIVLDGKPNEFWRLTGTIRADWVKQGAFPYAQVTSNEIAYNRPSGYERLVVIPSICGVYTHEGYRLQLAGSYQYMGDKMTMDQDYTTADIFTLVQSQQQHNGTIDALLSGPKPCEWYEWKVGLSGFAKTNKMSAPVTFMREGIDEIILGNANKGIQTVFPEDSIEIRNQEIPIGSDFGLYNAGVAGYHQSHFQFGKWHINAGVRLDYEYTHMDYLSQADIDYRFTMIMDYYSPVHTEIKGSKHAHYLQVLPRLAVSYEHEWVTAYAYAAKGYKAGGYNPQIFSTITQNQVMTDLAADMGLHLEIADKRYSDVAITEYKPETDWTFEIGAHFTPVEGLKIDIDGFHIQCYDQQVTVFPNGKTTGRMMANAARSRVWGVEAALRYGWSSGNWSGWLDASYGWTDARFIEFDDGMGTYSGNYIPYAPQHTLHGLVSAKYSVGRKWLEAISVGARVNMVGTIYWNEQNSLKQSPYALLGAHISLDWKYVQVQLWGKNLTNSKYDVFYFRSMGNDFLQHGKPIEWGGSVILNL